MDVYMSCHQLHAIITLSRPGVGSWSRPCCSGTAASNSGPRSLNSPPLTLTLQRCQTVLRTARPGRPQRLRWAPPLPAAGGVGDTPAPDGPAHTPASASIPAAKAGGWPPTASSAGPSHHDATASSSSNRTSDPLTSEVVPPVAPGDSSSSSSSDGPPADVGAASATGSWLHTALDIGTFALPLAAQNVLGYSLNALSGSLIGRLGPSTLSASTLGNSAYCISGLSLVWGGAAGLETLVGQAHGAGQPRLMRLVLLRAVLVSWAVCVPVVALWMSAEAALLALGQSPGLVPAAATYLQSLGPSLFAYSLSECLQVYLVVQGLAKVTTAAKLAVTALGPLYYMGCIFWLDMGLVGAGYAYTLCKATNAALLLGWLGWRSLRGARPPEAVARAAAEAGGIPASQFGVAPAAAAAVSIASSSSSAAAGAQLVGGGVSGLVARLRGAAAAFREEVSEALDMAACREYIRFGVPAAVMCCLEWWAYEALIIMAGWLPNADLAVGCLGICLTVGGWMYMVPQAIATATCARVAAALGSSDAAAAKRHYQAAYGLVVAVQLVLACCLLPNAARVAAGFCPDPAAAALTASLLPIAALNTLGDGLNCVLNNGVLRACGRQALGARLHLVSYWCCGLPAAYLAAFKLGFGVSGFVAAIGATSLLQSMVVAALISRWDWQLEVRNSQKLLSNMAAATTASAPAPDAAPAAAAAAAAATTTA